MTGSRDTAGSALTLPQGLLLAVATVVASASAAAWAASWAAPAPASPPEHPALQTLVDEIRDLAQVLRERPPTPAIAPTGSGAAPAQPPRSVSQPDPGERLDRLAAAVERIAGAGAPATAEPFDSLSPRDRTRPVSWQALRILAQRTKTDPDAARRSVLFLTPRQIVERYGLPTDMGGGDGRVWLQYEYPEAGGAEYVYLHFVFVDGMLMRYDAETGS